MIPDERFHRVRAGGRRAERRADRHAALLQRVLTQLDDLADEIEAALDKEKS